VAVAGPAQEVIVSDTYEIRVVGALRQAGRTAFSDLTVEVEPTATVLSGEMNQAALHEVLDRIRALGLELIDVKLAPARPPG
jgi:hypothetical protein